jgi:hypothetical protein
MKNISLTQGKFAMVDDEDYEYLNRHKWYFEKGYAARKEGVIRGKITYMHRVIMQTPDGMDTDHINGNKLDNRRENLRVCTHAQNTRNRNYQINNTSGYKGVSFDKSRNKWHVAIKVNGLHINKGRYDTVEEAARAYDEAARYYFGEYAGLNFPEGGAS